MSSSRIGIIIWRMNPLHIWHQELISMSLKNEDKTLIFLWSSKYRKNKNPFSYEERKNFIEMVFPKQIYKNQLIILEIHDQESDLCWIKSLIYQIGNIYTGEHITFYWWDLKNDYAISCIRMYKKYFQWYIIWFHQVDRYIKTIYVCGQKLDISGTAIRKALKEWNRQIVDKMVDKKIVHLLQNSYT